MAKIKRIGHGQNSPEWLGIYQDPFTGAGPRPDLVLEDYSSSPNTQPAFTSRASASANNNFADGHARPSLTSS